MRSDFIETNEIQKRQAVKNLFDVLHEIPTDVVLTLYRDGSVTEITPIRFGSSVERNDSSEMMEVIEILPNGHYLTETFDEYETLVVSPEEVRIVFPEEVPNFDTMWQFNDPNLIQWLEQLGNIDKIGDCGFRIYQYEELGYLLGMEHDNYENIEKCFELLYDAMDLNWHLVDSYQLIQSVDAIASNENTIASNENTITGYFETKEVTTKAFEEMMIHALKTEIISLEVDYLFEIPYELETFIERFPELISHDRPYGEKIGEIQITQFKIGELELRINYEDEDEPFLSYDRTELDHYSEIVSLAHFKELVISELDNQLTIKRGVNLAEKLKSKEQQFDELVGHIESEIKKRPGLFELHFEDEKAMALAFKMADSEWNNGLILINKEGRYLAYDTYEGFGLLNTRIDDALFKEQIDKFGELFSIGVATAYSLNNQYQAVMDAGGQVAYDIQMKKQADYKNAMHDDHSDERLQRDEDIRITNFIAKDRAKDQHVQPVTLKERLSQIKNNDERTAKNLKLKEQKSQTIRR